MDQLPFLVVYGGWLASAAVIATALLGIGGIVVARQVMATLRARAEVARWASATTERSAGEVTVRGIYCVHGDACWIQHGIDRLEVVGSPTLSFGSVLRRGGAPALRDGDEVIARGALVRAADRGERPEATYREEAGAWELTSVELAAIRPAARPTPLRGGVVAWLGGLLVVGYLALRGVGLLVLPGEPERPIDPTDLAEDGRLAIAAALPGVRDAALEQLQHLVDRGRGHAALQLEIATLRGDTTESRVLLEIMWRDDEALAMTRDASAQRDELLVRLGRYDEARHEVGPIGIGTAALLQQAAVAIGSRRWQQAAELVELIAPLRDSPESLPEGASGAIVFKCAAQLFRAYAGERDADHALRAMAAEHAGRCRLLAALAARDGAAIASTSAELPAGGDARALADVAAWSYGFGAPDQEGATDPVDAMLGPWWDAPQIWLAPFAAAARDTFETRAWLVVATLVRGDLAGARARMADVRAAAGSDADRARAGLLAHAIELRAGALPATGAVTLDGALGDLVTPWRTSRGIRALGPCPHDGRAAFDAAIRGEGGPLARALETCSFDWDSAAPAVLAALPRVTGGRDRVARGLVGLHPDATLPSRLFELVGDLAMLRDLARLAGRDTRAAELQAAIDRHARALSDRDVVIGFLVWSLVLLGRD
jgi:hypothetical protein